MDSFFVQRLQNTGNELAMSFRGDDQQVIRSLSQLSHDLLDGITGAHAQRRRHVLADQPLQQVVHVTLGWSVDAEEVFQLQHLGVYQREQRDLGVLNLCKGRQPIQHLVV